MFVVWCLGSNSPLTLALLKFLMATASDAGGIMSTGQLIGKNLLLI